MIDAPPRIHTLRSGLAIPPTSDCFTPRTVEGNAAAFKGAKYGGAIEGPYRNGSVWVARAIWAVTLALSMAALLVVLAMP